MSDFEHKQFTREWFTARYDNGESVYDDDYIASDNHEFGHSGVEASHIPITIYRAVAIEVPWRRAYWDAESESVETCDIEGYEDPQGAKSERHFIRGEYPTPRVTLTYGAITPYR